MRLSENEEEGTMNGLQDWARGRAGDSGSSLTGSAIIL